MGLPAEKVRALQLNFEGLLQLNKTDPDRFWEILKGITSRQESEIATIVVEHMSSALKGVEVGMRQLQQLATSEKAS
jgi:hypothetical protein